MKMWRHGGDRLRRLSFELVVIGLAIISGTAFAEASVLIRGSVNDAAGRALPEARVTLHPMTTRYVTGEHLLAGRPGSPPLREVLASSIGTFKIQAPEIGMWRLQVNAPGFVPAQIRLTPLLEAVDLEPVTLLADEGLSVKLVDSGQRAVPHAEVVVYRKAPKRRNFRVGGADYPTAMWHTAPFLGRTDEAGHLRIPSAKQDEVTLQIVAEGFPQTLKTVKRSGATLELVGAPSRKIKILDERAQAVPSVLVFADRQPYPLGRTGEDGILELALAPRGKTRVTLSSSDRSWGTYNLGSAGEESGDLGPTELVLHPPVIVRGKVFNNLTQESIAGALVWPNRFYGYAVRADRNGAFEIAMETPDGYLAAGLYGYRPADSASFMRKTHSESDRSPRSIAVGLQPVVVVSGQVLDARGEGLEGVEILPLLSNHPVSKKADGEWQTLTGKDGHFVLERLLAGADYRVRLRASARRPAPNSSALEITGSKTTAPKTTAPKTSASKTSEVVTYGDTWVELGALEAGERLDGLIWTLNPGRHGEGWVVDENDAPLAGAKVVLRRSTGYQMNQQRLLDMPPDTYSATSDGEGRFQMLAVPAGRYDLVVRASGSAPARIPGVVLSAEEASFPGPWDLGTVALGPSVSVVGKVEDEDGRGIEGAGIQARSMTAPFELKTKREADAEGEFRIDDLAPDQILSMDLQAKGFLPLRSSIVRAPQEDLRLVMKRGSGITGSVSNATGWPIHRARVSLRPEVSAIAGQTTASSSTDEEGGFLLDAAAPGIGTLKVTAPGYLGHSRSLKVPEVDEPNLHIDVVLELGATLTGRTVGDDGSPVVSADINAYSEEQGSSMGGPHFARSDAEGHFEIRGLPQGKIQVAAYKEQRNSAHAEVEISGDKNDVELVFEAGESVSGRVLLADGSPIIGATVMLLHEEGLPTNQPVRSISGGRFRFEHVRLGEYVIRAVEEQGREVSEIIRVHGAVEDLELLIDDETGATLNGRIEGLGLDEIARVRVRAQGITFREGSVSYDGTFEILGLQEGKWTIRAQVDGGGRVAQARIEIDSGQRVAEATLEFKPGFELRGLVRINEEPAGSMFVMMTNRETSQVRHDRTLHDGAFLFRGLPTGIYDVVVQGSDGVRFERSVSVDDDREIVIESQARSISGSVLDSAGRGIESVGLFLYPVRSSSSVGGRSKGASVTSQRDGRFIFRLVEAGEWRLVARHAGYREAAQELTIPEAGSDGGFENLEIRLEQAGAYEFRANRTDGTQIYSLQYVLTDASERRVDSGFLYHKEGVFSLNTAPAGRWNLWLQEGPGALEGFPIDVGTEPSETVVIEQFTLKPMVSVTVDSASQKPGTSYRMAVWGSDGKLLRLCSDPRQGFVDKMRVAVGTRFMLPIGTWKILLEGFDGRLDEQLLEAVPGQDLVLRAP